MNDKNGSLSIFSILLAVNIFLYTFKCKWWLYILINIGVFAVSIIIIRIQSRLDNQNKKWIDAIYYFFSRREQKFKILEKTAVYEIVNEQSASYYEELTLKAMHEGKKQIYVGRYVWDQDEPIRLAPLNDSDTVESEYDWKWTKVSMCKKGFLKKGEEWETGFKLDNLKLYNFKKKLYISNKVCDKVKILNLTIKLPKNGLGFNHKAKLVVEDFYGRAINEDGEEIKLDAIHNCYSKTLTYPRKGRKYIIKVYQA